MKKFYLPVLTAVAILFSAGYVSAQTTIGASQAPDASAVLDIQATNKGVLFPQVSLTNTGTWGLAGAATKDGMVVYNTNASIAGVGAQGKGLYVWITNAWKQIASGTEWYSAYGTNDALSDKTGAINRTGNVGIGLPTNTTPSTLLHVNSLFPGAVRIVDGTQGDGRVLTSDVNGQATWQTRGPQTTQGTVPVSDASWAANTGYHYTGFYVDVPPGRSTITSGLIVKAPGSGYITCRLAYSASSMGSFPTEAVPNYSGFTVVGPATTTSAGQVMWYINNVTGGTLRLFMWMGAAAGAATSSNITLGGSGNFLETFIMCAY